jgi:hypothetical protein
VLPAQIEQVEAGVVEERSLPDLEAVVEVVAEEVLRETRALQVTQALLVIQVAPQRLLQ